MVSAGDDCGELAGCNSNGAGAGFVTNSRGLRRGSMIIRCVRAGSSERNRTIASAAVRMNTLAFASERCSSSIRRGESARRYSSHSERAIQTESESRRNVDEGQVEKNLFTDVRRKRGEEF
jgi:hypothetical protein